jgi:hypothetical protein
LALASAVAAVVIVAAVVVFDEWRAERRFLTAAGVVVILAPLLVFLWVRVWRRRKRSRDDEPSPESVPVVDDTPVPKAGTGRELLPVLDQAPVHQPARTVHDLVVGDVAELRDLVIHLPETVVAGARYDSRFFGGLTPGGHFVVRGASLPGLSHVERADPGQDSIGVCWLPRRQTLLAAVADGVGSKADSGRCSEVAIGYALEYARKSSSRSPELLKEIVGRTAEFLQKESGRKGWNGATTLALAEIRRIRGGAAVRVAAVGDSEVWTLAGGRWNAVYHERAVEGTHALPQSRIPAVVDEMRIASGDVLTLATDGFALALDTGGSVLAQQLAVRWRSAPDPKEFMNLVDFKDQYFLDDRGVVAIWVGDD